MDDNYYLCDPANFSINNTIDGNKNDYLKEIISDGRKYLSCTFPCCGKIFRFKSEFLRHTLSHTQQRSLDCPFARCLKSFKRKDSLKSHMRTHTGETPFKCQEPGCGKSYSNRAGYSYHILTHRGKKEYRCRFAWCNKIFMTLQQLKQHETVTCHHKGTLWQINWSQQNGFNNGDANEFGKQESMPGLEFITEEIGLHKNFSEDEAFVKMAKILVRENDVMKKKIIECNIRNEIESKHDPLWEGEEQMKLLGQEVLEEKRQDFLQFDDLEKYFGFE